MTGRTESRKYMYRSEVSLRGLCCGRKVGTNQYLPNDRPLFGSQPHVNETEWRSELSVLLINQDGTEYCPYPR
jgi:hypothetical protein